jgi:hypothetical protein
MCISQYNPWISLTLFSQLTGGTCVVVEFVVLLALAMRWRVGMCEDMMSGWKKGGGGAFAVEVVKTRVVDVDVDVDVGCGVVCRSGGFKGKGGGTMIHSG